MKLKLFRMHIRCKNDREIKIRYFVQLDLSDLEVGKSLFTLFDQMFVLYRKIRVLIHLNWLFS